jgi:Cu-Zn family superoxide dismutase
MSYYDKYLKYKTKYMKQKGGAISNAICIINGYKTADGEHKSIRGKIYFDNVGHGVKVYGEINGDPSELTEGNHGFHVHESGNLEHCCTSLKAHLNPYGNKHGGRTRIDEHGNEVINYNRHMGDLGNIYVDKNGKAVIDFVDPIISLTGEHSIIGRSIIVHKNPDDLGMGRDPKTGEITKESQTTGSAGDRIACGIIGIA